MSEIDANTIAKNNIALTKEMFVCLGNRDLEGIMERLDPDIFIQFYGSDEIPYAGEYRGLAESRKFFETVFESVNIHMFQAEDYIGSGDMVIGYGQLSLTTKTNGNPIVSDWAHVITCKDGKWLRFRDFMNSVVAYKAFTNNVA